jgi:integrase
MGMHLFPRSMHGEIAVVRANIKGVFSTYKTLRDGSRKTYWYHRGTGKPLRGKPGSPEFMTDYTAAESTSTNRHEGTLSGLIRAYTLSTEFDELLAPTTQISYRRMLAKAEADLGDMPLSGLDDPRVRRDFLDWREKIARNSGNREADHRLSAISAMLTWAKDRGRLSFNYVSGFKRLYHSDRADIIWLPEHIEVFMSVAPIEMQRALILALHTGQREGDLLRLPWSAYDGGRISLQQGKGSRGRPGRKVEIPCTMALRKMLDSMERKSPLVLTTKTGRSMKKRYFLALWDRAMRDAGLQSVLMPGTDTRVKLHFHDLRGTAVTLLSEAECTPQQIATITGHSIKTVHRILEKYLSRTRGIGEQAIFNFENSARTKFANQLQTRATNIASRK